MSGKADVKFAQSRWQKVPRQGEVFPLPAYEAEAAARVGLSRGCRSRVGRRRHFQEDVAECLWALDWNSGLAGQSPCGPPSSVQQEVVERVEAAVERRVPPPGQPTAEAAGCALLGSRAGYGAAGEVKLAAFKAGAVALTEDASECPLVETLVRGEARRLLEAWEECMLRPEDDYLDVIQNEGKLNRIWILLCVIIIAPTLSL